MPRIGAVGLVVLLALGGCETAPASPSPDGVPSPSQGTASQAPGAGIDLLLRNGHVITLDPNRPAAEAVAVRGDRIEAVGSDAELASLAGASTLIIDLDGRTVVPGFIDAHEHRIGDGPRALGVPAADIAAAAVAQGWTTIDELYVDEARLAELQALDAAGSLPIRVNAYLPANENSAEGRSLGDYYTAYQPGQQVSPHVRVAGLKVFTDFDNATILLWKQPDLDTFVLARLREGWPLGIKTVSTTSLDMILRAMRSAAQTDTTVDVRGTRLEHMLFATRTQIEAIADLGMIPAINLNAPGQLVGVAEIDDLVGREPDGSYVPWRDVFDAGIPAAGISGFPSFYVDEPTGAPFGSPIHLIWQGVTRAGNLGVQSPPELLDQAITADEGLRSLTINAAAASGEAADKGSIEARKLADVVVLSANPVAVPPAQINDIETLMTLIGGEVAWCAPEAAALCAGGAAPGATATATSTPTSAASAAPFTVTASRSLPENPPAFAADMDPETAWIAGAGPEQWIQVELASPLAVRSMALLVTQDPAGETRHEIWVGSSTHDLHRVQTLAGATAEGDQLVAVIPEGAGEIRVIRIVTTKSPSWVAWREILLSTGQPMP